MTRVTKRGMVLREAFDKTADFYVSLHGDKIVRCKHSTVAVRLYDDVDVMDFTDIYGAWMVITNHSMRVKHG